MVQIYFECQFYCILDGNIGFIVCDIGYEFLVVDVCIVCVDSFFDIIECCCVVVGQMISVLFVGVISIWVYVLGVIFYNKNVEFVVYVCKCVVCGICFVFM